MGKKNLKRKIRDLQEEVEVLNEDLDQVVAEVQALQFDVRRYWQQPNADTQADRVTEAWKLVNQYTGQAFETANAFRSMFNLGAKPRINDEG